MGVENLVIQFCVAFVVLAEKFRCDDFGFRSPQFYIFLLLANSHRAAHDVDADKCLTLLREGPVDEKRRGVRMRRATRQQQHLGFGEYRFQKSDAQWRSGIGHQQRPLRVRPRHEFNFSGGEELRLERIAAANQNILFGQPAEVLDSLFFSPTVE